MLIVRNIPEVAQSPIALTIGSFDGVHLGHQAMLKRLKQLARPLGIPACVMTFEPQPREFFTPEAAPARLTTLREKIGLIGRFEIERLYVCRFDSEFARKSPQVFITDVLRKLAVRWLLVGEDFRFGARRTGDVALLREASIAQGYEVAVMPSVNVDGVRISSSAVRLALMQGNLAYAEALLGRPYSISGRVVHGDKLGAKIGYPTANIALRRNKAPLSGIFAVEVEGLGKKLRRGVASLGVRPTVKADGAPLLEVHLFDAERDLYGKRLNARFLHKLRDEQKFPDLESLTAQIALDVKTAKAWFERAACAIG